MPRPRFGTPEWLAYFRDIVNSSKTRWEAVRRLGYSQPSVIYYHLEKFGMESPREWSRRPFVREVNQRDIPDVIIPTILGRRWVAGLTQGEGCIQARFYTQHDVTYLQLDVSMADPEPIFKFSDYVGLSHPSKPVKNHEWKPNWHKNVSGLRAFRVLNEIRPFLLGEKLKEAEKALTFFAPYGIHRGCFGNLEIWSRNEFPWRTKKRGFLEGYSNLDLPLDLLPGATGHAALPEVRSSSDLMNQWRVPKVVIASEDDRAWTGGLVQGEVCVESHYIKRSDSTTLDLDLKMTDAMPVFRFADVCGLPRPPGPLTRANRWQPVWRKNIAGIRALRVLREIHPFLVGQKRREAERAFEFFDSNGYHRGRFVSSMIWLTHEFPLRRQPVKQKANESGGKQD